MSFFRVDERQVNSSCDSRDSMAVSTSWRSFSVGVLIRALLFGVYTSTPVFWSPHLEAEK